jgi:hypothetical protein
MNGCDRLPLQISTNMNVLLSSKGLMTAIEKDTTHTLVSLDMIAADALK